MEKKHRKHLKNRKSAPFNTLSKAQEDVAKSASNFVWEKINKKYPDLDFNNLTTLGLKDLDATYALEYINRGLKLNNLPERKLDILQAIDTAKGIKPDGGIFFVKSKNDGFDLIIGALEVKHQGEYDGYTPISDSEWKKKKGDLSISRTDRPPQAQGNAIERYAKNANAIKTLTSFYGYNPYVIFCEGFDFFLKDDVKIFEKQPYSSRFKGKDSSILMRLIAGNDWVPLNKIYVDCIDNGNTKICPAAIFARMPKWSTQEVSDVLLKTLEKSIKHLHKIGEL
jgi:type II restriction enzyme